MNDFTLQKGLVLSLFAEQIIAIILSHIYKRQTTLPRSQQSLNLQMIIS